MAATLREVGFESLKADLDVWMQKGTKPDGFEYWEYVLVYVNDVIAFSVDPKAIMDYLSSRYTLKDGMVQEPDSYLGAKILKWKIEGSDDPNKMQWGWSAEAYIKLALKDIEQILTEAGKKLPTKAMSPFSHSNYHPELDATDELDATQTKYFQGLIGVL
jgi:hypothetical protein